MYIFIRLSYSNLRIRNILKRMFSEITALQSNICIRSILKIRFDLEELYKK